MNKTRQYIKICGIGPGNPDYISKVVWQQVGQTDVLIGGKRQLEIFEHFDKTKIVFDGKTTNLKKSIEQIKDNKIVVLVSGDTGFHSLRLFFKQTFPYSNIELYPGISSFQYFYAKLGLGYENAFLASMHGTEINFIEKLKDSSSVFLLTDSKNNYQTIASTLVDNGYGNYLMHIGNNLSYPDEQIVSLKVHDINTLAYDFKLCSVIIENPDLA